VASLAAAYTDFTLPWLSSVAWFQIPSQKVTCLGSRPLPKRHMNRHTKLPLGYVHWWRTKRHACASSLRSPAMQRLPLGPVEVAESALKQFAKSDMDAVSYRSPRRPNTGPQPHPSGRQHARSSRRSRGSIVCLTSTSGRYRLNPVNPMLSIAIH
jgi:hypothetical protein